MKLANVPLGNIGDDGTGLGPFGAIGKKGGDAGITGVVNLISTVVGALTVVAAIWFLFMLLFAGYEWISAGGDAKKLSAAKDRITHAFIGLVIVVGSWSLLAVTGQFLGIDAINPASVINKFPKLGN